MDKGSFIHTLLMKQMVEVEGALLKLFASVISRDHLRDILTEADKSYHKLCHVVQRYKMPKERLPLIRPKSLDKDLEYVMDIQRAVCSQAVK